MNWLNYARRELVPAKKYTAITAERNLTAVMIVLGTRVALGDEPGISDFADSAYRDSEEEDSKPGTLRLLFHWPG